MYHKGRVFAAACLGMLLFGIVFLSLGSVNNMLSERFQLDDNAIGTLTALLPLGILGGSLVFGPVVDRFGYRWMLICSALTVGACLEGMAFATEPRLIQLFVFLIGFGGGILNGATNALAADVSAGERGARLSLLGVFFGLGALTMPSTVAVLSRTFSLPSIVAAIGALVLIPAAYWMVIVFPPPKQKSGRISLTGGFALLRDPCLLLAGLALAIQSGMEGMSNDWMTRYFKNVRLAGSSVEWKTQLSLVALTGAMAATRLALAGPLKRCSSRQLLLASLPVSALGATLFLVAEGFPLSLAAAALIGTGLAAGFPLVLGYMGDRYPQQSGSAFSTIFVMALVGNTIINKTFGFVAHHHGVRQYPVMLLGCLAASATLLILMIRQLKGANSSLPS
jgi:fucose permease